jgi:hypothetical protein
LAFVLLLDHAAYKSIIVSDQIADKTTRLRYHIGGVNTENYNAVTRLQANTGIRETTTEPSRAGESNIYGTATYTNSENLETVYICSTRVKASI